jgi:hypothetical protein
VIAIACGDYHSLALRRDGTVVAWGGEWTGTNVPPDLTDVVAIAAGYSHSIALRSDGTIVTWGGSYNVNQTVVPVGLRQVVSISGGSYHSLALVAEHLPAVPPPEPTLKIQQQTGSYRLELLGDPRHTFVLESSADPRADPGSWSFRRNLRPTGESSLFFDLKSAEAAGSSTRFYRARLSH